MTSLFTLIELKKGFMQGTIGAMKHYEVKEKYGLTNNYFC